MPLFMMEFDLSGAEWVVTAYLAKDKNMIGVIKSGKSPHIVTGSLMSGAPEWLVALENEKVGMNTDPEVIGQLRDELETQLQLEDKTSLLDNNFFLPRSMSIRQAGKKSNHGLNYGMKYKRFALDNEIPEADARIMVEAYSNTAYPGLQDYWSGIREELRKNNRELMNCFGRKVRLLDEWGPDLWNAAYSFKPQSTVVDCCNDTLYLIYEDKSPQFEPIILGAQVHDSVMVEYPDDAPPEHIGYVAHKIGMNYIRPVIDYGEPFRLDSEIKVGYNWGSLEKVKWGNDFAETGALIKQELSRAAAELQPA